MKYTVKENLLGAKNHFSLLSRQSMDQWGVSGVSKTADRMTDGDDDGSSMTAMVSGRKSDDWFDKRWRYRRRTLAATFPGEKALRGSKISAAGKFSRDGRSGWNILINYPGGVFRWAEKSDWCRRLIYDRGAPGAGTTWKPNWWMNNNGIVMQVRLICSRGLLLIDHGVMDQFFWKMRSIELNFMSHLHQNTIQNNVSFMVLIIIED